MNPVGRNQINKHYSRYHSNLLQVPGSKFTTDPVGVVQPNLQVETYRSADAVCVIRTTVDFIDEISVRRTNRHRDLQLLSATLDQTLNVQSLSIMVGR